MKYVIFCAKLNLTAFTGFSVLNALLRGFHTPNEEYYSVPPVPTVSNCKVLTGSTDGTPVHSTTIGLFFVSGAGLRSFLPDRTQSGYIKEDMAIISYYLGISIIRVCHEPHMDYLYPNF